MFSTRVARRFGFLSVAAAVYESDDETPTDRDNLMNTFAGTATTAAAPVEKQFRVVLAEAIAAGWRPQRIDVAAFRRGPTAEVVSFAPFVPGRWVDAGEQLDWTLTRWRTIRWPFPTPWTTARSTAGRASCRHQDRSPGGRSATGHG